MKVMITGASGQVGSALLASAPPGMELRPLTRLQLDISDATAVRAAVADFGPALIVNAAAYTAVDKAESEPGLAGAINSQGPRNLAQSAHDVPGCRLLHISTDYVFDGRAEKPYRPSDPTNPLGVYGRTKLSGEQAVLEVLRERAVVLRTAWVYASQGKNFLLTMLRLMRERGTVRVVADQFGTPTTAHSIARALWAISERPTVGHILHWTDAGKATWHEFAVAIAEEGRGLGLLPGLVQVLPIPTSEYPTAALRPHSSVLDCREAISQLGFAPAPWRDGLRATLQRMVGP